MDRENKMAKERERTRASKRKIGPPNNNDKKLVRNKFDGNLFEGNKFDRNL